MAATVEPDQPNGPGPTNHRKSVEQHLRSRGVAIPTGVSDTDLVAFAKKLAEKELEGEPVTRLEFGQRLTQSENHLDKSLTDRLRLETRHLPLIYGLIMTVLTAGVGALAIFNIGKYADLSNMSQQIEQLTKQIDTNQKAANTIDERIKTSEQLINSLIAFASTEGIMRDTESIMESVTLNLGDIGLYGRASRIKENIDAILVRKAHLDEATAKVLDHLAALNAAVCEFKSYSDVESKGNFDKQIDRWTGLAVASSPSVKHIDFYDRTRAYAINIKGVLLLHRFISRGRVSGDQALVEEAMDQFGQALAIRATFSRALSNQAICFKFLGELKLKQSEYARADELFMKSLTALRKAQEYAQDNLSLAVVLNNIASLYIEQSRRTAESDIARRCELLDEAEESLARALSVPVVIPAIYVTRAELESMRLMCIMSEDPDRAKQIDQTMQKVLAAVTKAVGAGYKQFRNLDATQLLERYPAFYAVNLVKGEIGLREVLQATEMP